MLSTQPPPTIVPAYFTVEEMSTHLRVRVWAIYKLAKDKKLPFIKLGKRLLFPRDAVEAMLAARTVAPTASSEAS
jgi:excisionase family DNA binding protein